MLHENIRKAFVKSAAGCLDANSYLGIIYEDKLEHKYFKIGRGPCHGDLNTNALTYKKDGLKKTNWSVLSNVQPLRTKKETALSFYDWLFNRSPWKDVFLVKDSQEAIDNGIIANTELPENLVISGLIASRFVTESYNTEISERARMYDEIKSLGFSENFAFIFSQVFKFLSEKKYQIQYTPISSGHCVFEFHNADEIYYKNFIDNTPENLSDITFQKNGGYGQQGYTGSGIWGKSGTQAFGKWLKACKPIVYDKAVNYNIFEKIPTVGVVITTAEGFKNVLHQIEERINNAK